MKLIRSALSSANAVLSRQFQSPLSIRAFSASSSPVSVDWHRLNLSESFGDNEQSNFGDGRVSKMDSFYRKLGKAEKIAHDRKLDKAEKIAHDSFEIGGLGDGYNSLIDGMDNKLKKAATYFEFDPIEVANEDYAFRPDVNFQSGMTYDTKDLDLRKPGVRKPNKRMEFETTTEEVLREADFRNVKFLAKFITEAGIIIKRSKTGISAKAQRKVAREIKTARAFGLMPFTTMGTKHFKYGDSMETMDNDFAFEASYDHTFVQGEGAEA